MKKYLALILIYLGCLSALYGQSGNAYIITGVIRSEAEGLSVPVASLSLTLSGTHTRTDKEGRFSISLLVPLDTLKISHAAFMPFQIVVKSGMSSPLQINLEPDVRQLAEVVVNTGYEKFAKERATGSFEHINNQQLNEQTGTTILERLKGMSAGLLFDNKNLSSQRKLNISIRGLSTINGPQDPLIVLDNFPFEGNLDQINPNDIESVTILKDAAAASIWGTRAGNGVIVITSKQGRYNQPFKVELNTNFIVQQKPDLYYLPLMSSSDYIDVEQFLFRQGYYDNTLFNSPHSAVSPAVDIFHQTRLGNFSAPDSAKLIGNLKQTDLRSEYMNEIYQQAISRQYALNMSGGAGKMNWYLSGNLDLNTSHLSADYERLSVQLKNQFKPVDRLELSIRALYTQSKTANGKPDFYDIHVATRSLPYINLLDDEGRPLSIARYNERYTDTAGDGLLLDWKYYPMDDYRHHTTNNLQSGLLMDLVLKFRVVNGVHLNISYQYQHHVNETDILQNADSYGARNLVNLFSQINRSTGIVNYIVPKGGILNTMNSRMQGQNLRGIIQVEKRMNRHLVTAIGGSEIRETKTNSNNHTVHGYQQDILTAGMVDLVNPYPTYLTGNLAHIGGGSSFSGRNNRFVSFFGNAAYTYQNRYILSGSFRNDGSNLFGVSSNNKWKPLWSAGLAWDISKESFYKIDKLPLLKLRFTYGYSGNADPSISALSVMNHQGITSYARLQQANVEQISNPSLKWEEVGTFNVGVEFATAQQVISGSLEWYQKNGVDLLGPSPVDYTTVIRNTLIRNVASMNGHGVDLVLKTRNMRGKFEWNTNLLLSTNTSKTKDYYINDPLQGLVTLGNNISPIPGKPLYSLISYRWAGLDPATGSPRGIYDGAISADYRLLNAALADNLVYSGSSSPVVFGSLQNQFSYKGFTLSAMVTFKLKYYQRKSPISYNSLINSGNGHADYASRWQKPGDELITNVPSFIYPNDSRRDAFYRYSEVTVYRGDHIRLQYINLSYDLLNSLKINSVFKSIQLYINAADLGVLWRANKDGIDPDFGDNVPTPSRYTFGCRVQL